MRACGNADLRVQLITEGLRQFMTIDPQLQAANAFM